MGWLLDCKDRNGASTMEIYPCLIPDCESPGKEITLISLDTMKFTKTANHPKEGYIMSIGRINQYTEEDNGEN